MVPGDPIGNFVILGVLGRGAFGTVLLGHPQGNPGRKVALKVLSRAGQGDEDAWAQSCEQFFREARLLAGIDHPGIVRILGMDIVAEPPYIVMEFAEGGSLWDRMRQGAMSADLALPLVRTLAATLHDLHTQRGGICHRDIKPANILLRGDGSPIFSDLGISRRMDTGTFTMQWGTSGYAPPERLRYALAGDDRAPDPQQWDIYSLGVVLYEVVTGRRAFSEDGPTDGDKVMREQLRRHHLDTSPWLEGGAGAEGLRALIRDMTAADPARRLRTAAEVVARVDALLAPATVPTPSPRLAPPPPSPRLGPPPLSPAPSAARRPASSGPPGAGWRVWGVVVALAVGVFVCAGTLGGLGVWRWGRGDAPVAEEEPTLAAGLGASDASPEASPSGAPDAVASTADERATGEAALPTAALAAVPPHTPASPGTPEAPRAPASTSPAVANSVGRGTPTEPTSGLVIIVSDPEGATIYVNDVARGETPVRVVLPYDTYWVKAMRRGYKTELRQVNLRIGQVTVPFLLKPEVVTEETAENAGVLGALHDDSASEGMLRTTSTSANDMNGIGGLIGDRNSGGGLSGSSGTQTGSGTSAGDPIILGALDKSLIDAVVKRNLVQIRYCYERELKRAPGLTGKIIVKFVIDQDGTVSSAVTNSTTMNNAAVESCINGRFMQWQFPEPKGGGIVIVSYPFVFEPG